MPVRAPRPPLRPRGWPSTAGPSPTPRGLWGQAAGAAERAGRPAAERVGLLLAWCGSLTRQGGFAEAQRVRAEAIALARTTGDERLLAGAVTAWAVPAVWMARGYLERDDALIAEIEALLGRTADEELRSRLMCALISETERAGRSATPRRLALAREAERIADRLGDPGLVGLAAAAGLRLAYTGETLEERARLGARLHAAGHDLVGHQVAAQVAAVEGDMAAFDAARAAVEELAKRRQLGGGRLTALGYRGLRRSLAGRFAAAEEAYRGFGKAMERAGAHHGPGLALLSRMCVREATGDLPALLPQMPQLYAGLPDLTREPHARPLVAAGRLDEARAIWRPAEEFPDDFLAQVWPALRIGTAIALDAPEVLCEAARALEPHAGQLCAAVSGTMTLAPVAQYLGDAAAALGRPADAAAHYRHAIEIAERAGAAHYATRARARNSLAAL